MSRRKFVKNSLKVSKSETKAHTFYLVLELSTISLSAKTPITLAEEYKKHILITLMQHKIIQRKSINWKSSSWSSGYKK
ncbi:hypothetical protein VCRA2116O29_40118 [Vibrio crassostreae]|nr:hypothetical protein VCRA2116O29_40118 [Vibrio crassostreae]CAK2511081.1 hypothetical protein VCRA2119O48_40213 [Vibrio crassostreae]CAK3841692.1 hypothetical protein VCRA2123O74_40027 [Vibrio crassostreae]CAK3880709.1 hypothetical protein VCRA212O16_20027 [Vibrio crassostreae]